MSIKSMWKRLWRQINFATIIVFVGTVVSILYLFSYLFPLTDDAFVVNNVTPVSATVDGYITDLYVQNGEYVTKGQRLFKVFQEPYQLLYDKASAEYLAALQNEQVLIKDTAKNAALFTAAKVELAKLRYQYKLKSNPSVSEAIPPLEVKNLAYDIDSQTAVVSSLGQQLAIDDAQIKQQQQIITAHKAALDSTKVYLEQTVVNALNDGYVQNMYLGLRAPVKPGQPLFSLVDTKNTYIQANFNETDLRNVKVGDRVIIVSRMYFWRKIYHGVVVSDYWGVNRQMTDSHSQLQQIDNENQWLLLPQRMPVQIKITDLDSKYPLRTGMSAYVYIQN